MMRSLLNRSILLALASSLSAAEPYPGYEKDRELLRDSTVIAAGSGTSATIKASSPRAIQAARRLFARVPFLFKSRAEVLEVLGDPATLSDYGTEEPARENADLVYRFDSGYGGARYTIRFKDDQVWSVSVEESE